MSLVAEIRPTLRRLSRTPGFTAVSILTLALGIAGTTAAFSVINAVLLRPLPYHDPERLVQLWHAAPGVDMAQVEQSDASYIQYHDKATRSFESTGSYQVAASSLTGTQDPERVSSAYVTASLLPTLGVRPAVGRNFSEEEDRPGGAPAAILSDALWRRRYGGDPAIIGKTIQVDGTAREVVGIMPADFHFPDATTELWLPMAIDRAHLNNASFNRDAIGRLRPGVTIRAAEAEMTPLLQRLPDDAPGMMTRAMFEQAKIRVVLHSLRDDVIGDIRPILFTVIGSVALVLLIACANVASLFLVRAEARAKEVAVRSALGATPRSIVRLYLGEGLVLAVAGGALGVALAYAALGALLRLAPTSIPRASEISIDLASLGVAAVVAVVTGVFFSAIPFIRAGKASLTPMLRDGSRGSTSGRERQRVRSAFVVVQVALALVLLVGSGLLARSFQRMRAVDPGFKSDNVLTLRLALPEATYQTPGDIARFFYQVTTRLASVPGVQAAGATSKLPLVDAGNNNNAVWVEDHPVSSTEIPRIHSTVSVTQDYFKAMSIPIVEGRTFRDNGSDRAPHEMIVARAFARHYWPNGSALGKRVKTGGPDAAWSTIVGVVGDVHDDALTKPVDEVMYQPTIGLTQPQPDLPDTLVAENSMTLTIRTAGDPLAAFPAVRNEIWALDRNLPLVNVQGLSRVVTSAMARTTFTLLMIGAAAGVALLLGAIGIYGVISYMVSLRTREIGVRMALGARSDQVRRMVVRQGLVLAGIGAAIGLVGALAMSRLISSLLYGIAPYDPVTLGGVTLGLLVVAAVASWLPAMRAARIDPIEALRSDG
ncbi:MAG TPA: ABC transporter permease [Gemmatimonadaceae bacterium]|nr:ABC transporter permease [Gemmatimonadaceae bacterium]